MAEGDNIPANNLVVISPIRLLVSLVPTYKPIFEDGAWGALTTEGPEFIQGLVRKSEKRSLKAIKNYRQHEVKVNWLTSRY